MSVWTDEPPVCPVDQHPARPIPWLDAYLCPRGHTVEWNHSRGEWVVWPTDPVVRSP